MNTTESCACAESIARALGAWAGLDGTGPLAAVEPIRDCPWCGHRVVEPELAAASGWR